MTRAMEKVQGLWTGLRGGLESRTLLSRALVLTTLTAFAFISSWSAFWVRDFPKTYDGLAIDKIEMFRRAYLAHDFLPLWTPFYANGHGGPVLFLYHRLYTSTFGAVALVTGALWAEKISIPLLAFVGAVGMYRLVRVFDVSRLIAAAAGGMFTCAPYGVCDWFIRGATAEFTAMMLAPWCLEGCVLLARRRVKPWRLAVPLVLLFFAHSVLFYWFVPFLVATLIDALPRPFDWQKIPPVARDAAIVIGLTSTVILPYALGMYVAAPAFSLGTMSFLEAWPMDSMIHDTDFPWFGRQPWGLELDLSLFLVPAAIAIVILWRNREPLGIRPIAFLLTPIVPFFLLQSENLAFAIKAIPGGTMLQFPMRLEIFITPVVILAAALLTDSVRRHVSGPERWIMGVTLALSIAGLADFAWFEQATLDDHKRTWEDLEKSTKDLNPFNREYLPIGTGLSPGLPRPFLQVPSGCTLAVGNGQPVDMIYAPFHFKRLDVQVAGDRGCRLNSSQYDTPLLDVSVDGVKQTDAHRELDGTIAVDLPPGSHHVTIRQRRLLELDAIAVRGLRAGT
jgi:hypothetical protein